MIDFENLDCILMSVITPYEQNIELAAICSWISSFDLATCRVVWRFAMQFVSKAQGTKCKVQAPGGWTCLTIIIYSNEDEKHKPSTA
jgi:hypothetical protein